MNELEKAAAYFQKAIALDPGRIPAQKNLATMLWFIGKRSEATAIFHKLEKRIPNDPVPQLYLGLDDYEKKNMRAAAEHLERAGSLASDNPETFPIVIETYISAGRSGESARLLEQKIASGDSDSKLYRWLGEAYDDQMLPEKAFKAYSDAVKREPELEENYLALAGFALAHANAPFARDVLQKGLRRKPDSAKLLLEIGLAWAIQGDFETARKYFTQANAAERPWSLPLLALGVTDLQTGDAQSAAECFHRAREVAPDDYRCYYLHATALNRSVSNQDPASRAVERSELRRAIALNPHHAKARVALAETELADGHQASAESQLREALRLEPAEPTALYKLALLCRREGKTDESRRLLRDFQALKDQSHSEENEFVVVLKTLK
jgi:tetratricopeptide (TPR) repeat protein